MSIGSPCPDPKTIRSRLTVDEDLPHLVIVRTSSSGVLTSVTDPVREEACAVIWRAFFEPAPPRDLQVSCQVSVSSISTRKMSSSGRRSGLTLARSGAEHCNKVSGDGPHNGNAGA